MHGYALPARSRVTMGFWLALPSIGLAWGVAIALRQLDWFPTWWIDAPAVVGSFGLLLFVTDRWLWKWSLLEHIGLAGPNLDGTWNGVLRSSFDDHSQGYPVTVEITQTWSQMSISLSTSTSRSWSTAAAFERRPNGSWTMVHLFLSEPNADAPVDLATHRGTSVMVFNHDSLEGEYYSGRSRGNYGTISLQRSS